MVVCLFVAGRIPVKNVEKRWSSSKADNDLVGVWVQKGGEGKIGFAKTDQGYLVTSGTTGLEGGCRSFESNGHKFIIVAKLRAAVLGFDQVEEETKDGTLLRYKIEGDTLTMYGYDEGKLSEAIKAKQVAGEIDENDSAQLTELDDATVKWLGEAANGAGWSEQVYIRKPKQEQD